MVEVEGPEAAAGEDSNIFIIDFSAKKHAIISSFIYIDIPFQMKKKYSAMCILRNELHNGLYRGTLVLCKYVCRYIKICIVKQV